MAFQNGNRVKETTISTGTGARALAGAVPKFRTCVAGIGSGNTAEFFQIDDLGNWENYIATVTAGSPDTLTPTRIIDSSNGGAAVSWPAGTKTIACLAAASEFRPRYWMKQVGSRTLTSSTALQKLFDKTTNGALTLPPGVYLFEAFLYLTSMSATSGNALFDLLGAGTAVLSDIGYDVAGIDNTTPTAAAAKSGSSAITKSTPASMVAAGTGTALEALLKGTFTVTTGGTLIPSVQLVTAAAAVVNPQTYIAIEKLGESSESYRGPWS